jgi:hypothetical protein
MQGKELKMFYFPKITTCTRLRGSVSINQFVTHGWHIVLHKSSWIDKA